MFYKTMRFFVWCFMKVCYRLNVVGHEKMLQEGGCIVCSNHISNFDPVALAAATKRSIHFMAKKELFQSKLGHAFFTAAGIFPVDRKSGRDIQAYKTAISFLKKGDVLGIFFQGTRSTSMEAKDAKSGVIVFALKAKVPIVPVAISGEYKLLKQVTVTYGEPIYLTPFYDKKITQEIIDTCIEMVIEKIKDCTTPVHSDEIEKS